MILYRLLKCIVDFYSGLDFKKLDPLILEVPGLTTKVASISDRRGRTKLFTENFPKFHILAIEGGWAERRKRTKILNVKYLVSQLIRPHCSASNATLNFFLL